MISDEEREQVRDATDFVALVGETVVLRQRGSDDFWGCCPFHNEKSPSFHVRAAAGLWHCFGCGEGGDVFSYVQKRENLSFPDAIRYLADRAGIELHETGRAGNGPRRNRLVECLEEARDFYHAQLMRVRAPGNDAARAYFGGRGFNAPVCRRWGLGFAPGRGALVSHLRQKGFTKQEMLTCDLAVERNGRLQDRLYDRVTFPICNEVGRVIGMGGRVMGDAKPKYLNSKDSPIWHKSKHLFAFDRAKDAIVATGEVVVVEGYTDAISLHEAGFSNVVAVLGTALTLDHVRLLSRLRPRRITLMLDGDAAGQRAAEKGVRYVDKTEASLMSVVLPNNMDPAEYIAAEGADALRERLAQARPLVDFVLDKHFSTVDLQNPGSRVKALEDIARILAPLKDSMLLDGYASRVADYLGTSVEEVKRRVRAAKPLDDDQPRRRGSQQPGPQGGVPDDEPPYHTDGDPDALAPEDAWGVPAPTPALEGDEGRLVRMERELLSLMACAPDDLKQQADRIAGISWSLEPHQAMAWAMLATPPGASPADVVKAATEVVPDAPRILSCGSLESLSNAPIQAKAAFLLDNVELLSAKRRIRQIKALLAASAPSEEMRALFNEATELQKTVMRLQKQLSGNQ